MLHQLRGWLTEQLHIHDSVTTLQGLDDHLLADMGIARTEIAARVAGRSDHQAAAGRHQPAIENEKAAGSNPDGRRLACEAG
ncbi:MAG: DUF1127 domain-containing protein [Devosia sp.]|nr:DUF1127 domain-containing protein [Devosia sp.]